MSYPLTLAAWGRYFPSCLLLSGLCLDWGLNRKKHQGQEYMCRWPTPSNKQLFNSYHVSSRVLGPGTGEELKVNEIHRLPLRSSHSLSGWPLAHLYVIYYLLSIQRRALQRRARVSFCTTACTAQKRVGLPSNALQSQGAFRQRSHFDKQFLCEML